MQNICLVRKVPSTKVHLVFKRFYLLISLFVGSIMGVHYQVIFWLAVLTPAFLAYPHHSLLDPIDLCIIACDSCYKADQLVHCANECIATGGQVGLKWSTGCPRFNLSPYDINIED